MLKIVVLCVTLVITLIFGLHTKDFGREHTPFIDSAGNLSFTKYSIATTKANFSRSSSNRTDEEKMSLDIGLEIATMPEFDNRFSIIFSINDSQDESQMLLGQWQNYLIIMSGDDYANEASQPRITIPLDSIQGYVYPQELQIQIKATDTGTTVSINDTLKVQSSSYIAPISPSASMVSLGNSLNRKHGWHGSISAFDLDVSYCRSDDLNEHESSCSMAYTTNLQDTLKRAGMEPVMSGQDNGGRQASMWTLQPAYTALTTVWLSSDSMRYWNTKAFNKDLLVNLVGFIPISIAIFVMAATRFQLPAVAVLTITATFAISLLIESAQVLIPSRTSSIVDLSANSAAGILTTIACCIAMRWTRHGTIFSRKRRKKRRRRRGI